MEHLGSLPQFAAFRISKPHNNLKWYQAFKSQITLGNKHCAFH